MRVATSKTVCFPHSLSGAARSSRQRNFCMRRATNATGKRFQAHARRVASRCRNRHATVSSRIRPGLQDDVACTLITDEHHDGRFVVAELVNCVEHAADEVVGE